MAASSASVVESLENRRLLAAASGVVPPDAYFRGDLNGDGKLDLIVPGPHAVGVHLGNGDGTFAPAQRIALPFTPSRITGGDFNGDGVTDIVAAPEGNGIIAVLIGLQLATAPDPGQSAQMLDDPFFFDLGAELTSANIPRAAAGGLKNARLLSADFNGDGRDSLVVADEPRGVLIALLLPFRNAPTPPTVRPAVFPSPFGGGVRVAVGDINGDGRADLVGLDNKGQVHVAIGTTPAGTPAAGRFDDTDIVHLFPPGTRVDQVTVGDVNGDGVADIIAVSHHGGVRAVTLTEVLISSINIDLGPVPREVRKGVTVGDVNGDGVGDLFALTLTKDGILPYIEQGNLY